MENIYLISDNNDNKIELDIDLLANNNKTNDSINDLIENINDENINGENNKDNIDTIIEIPIKKKKGRKSKKIKELELGLGLGLGLEQEKTIEPVRRFPKLSEKIFDVLQINETEYYYDTNFNLLLDANVEPVGFKHDKKFIFYSDINDIINQIKLDDEKVKLMYNNYNNNNKY